MSRPPGLWDMSRWTGVLALVVACEAAPAAPTRRSPDKQELYGDASLVPTRAGEQARAELALAASVTAALRARAGSGRLAVEVRLPTADDPGGAVVAGALALDAESVVRVAEGVLGPWSAGRVLVELAEVGAVEGAQARAQRTAGAGVRRAEPAGVTGADPTGVAGPAGATEPAEPAGPVGPAWPAWQAGLLGLALVGLGVSAGVSIERLRRRGD